MARFANEIRYPEKGIKFFVEAGEPDELAWLNKAFQEFGSYADCYQSGAITLLNSALSEPELRSFNVYPAIFLIRHYIELRLKELIQGINYCLKQNRDFPIHHNLENLWVEFKSKYQALGENIDSEAFYAINSLIREMSLIDPISMAFRYPITKEGKIIVKPEYINLSILKETFIRVGFVFDGIAMQIAHFVDITEDMMRDVYENYW